MTINELNKSEKIPMNPFNFDFVGDDIAVYQHEKTSIYDTNLNKRFELPIYSNGYRNFITQLPNGGYSIFGKIYNDNGELTNKAYNVSKKSLAKFSPNIFVDHSNNQVIGGYNKDGIIVIYDSDLTPIKEVELDKFEVLIHINPNKKTAFTFNGKAGAVVVYSYPNFIKTHEFKVNNQNNQFAFSSEGKFIFNYGYKPDNKLINIETGEIKKVMFHPTTTSGYKEQYRTAHNFGTSIVKANDDFSYLAATTHQNKAVIYNVLSNTLLDLKIHEHFDYDKFNHPLGKYPFGNVIFEKERIIAAVGKYLTVWNYSGDLLFKKENITPVGKHPNGKYFALIDQCLTEINIS